ncbi:MAG: glycosyl hydrolase [Prolixibacteraceae bacterium]
MKTLKIISLCFAVMFLPAVLQAQPFEPMNKNATKEARELLTYLYELSGDKILSGQHNYGHELLRSTDTIVQYTGKQPAIWGSDWIPRDFKVDIDRGETANEAIRQHKKGSIITLMYHQSRPYADSMGYFRNKISDEEWEQLIIPGTPIHQTWLADIDEVAGHMKKLQKKNVPVLWRPYHEMNGGWFWWGKRTGENGYKKLWRILYDRLTNYHKLNNLIWVWNANELRGNNVVSYEDYYPGHDVVDLLATDVYTGNYDKRNYDALHELADGRPIAIGECGPVPTQELLNNQPEWVWFMIWARFPWGEKNGPEKIRELYNHPRVLTKEEVEIN